MRQEGETRPAYATVREVVGFFFQATWHRGEPWSREKDRPCTNRNGVLHVSVGSFEADEQERTATLKTSEKQ